MKCILELESSEKGDDMGKLAYEDYRLLPNDGKIHELIDGEHFNHPSPTTRHQEISGRLEVIFRPYIESNDLGHWFSAPLDVLLGPYDVVQPDKIFISKSNERIVTQANIKGVPDLLIEIISGDKAFDKRMKFKLYESCSVRHYWIVDPDDGVLSAYKLERKKYRLVGEFRKGDTFKPELFPRIRLPISQLFRKI